MTWGVKNVVAHRGLQRLFPENTQASILGAVLAGLTQMEIDVQMTADGVPVVYHDPTLERVSGRAGDIRQLSWAQVQRIPAHEPARFGRRYQAERISSLGALAQRLASAPGLQTLFVELKEESLKPFGREAMLAACAQALRPIHTRCVLISFDLPVLALARRDTRFKVGPVLRGLRQLRHPLVRAMKPDWIFCDDRLLPSSGSLKALFGRARSAVYEVPSAARAQALLRRGVTALETYRADSLAQELSLHR
jgi:glycerophosphoryl diester phosphodiesterase